MLVFPKLAPTNTPRSRRCCSVWPLHTHARERFRHEATLLTAVLIFSQIFMLAARILKCIADRAREGTQGDGREIDRHMKTLGHTLRRTAMQREEFEVQLELIPMREEL